MKKQHLITSATYNELSKTIEQYGQVIKENRIYSIWNNTHILITGVGQVNTVYSLMRYFMDYGKPGNLINLGICGSFSKKYPPGSIVQVSHEIAGNQLTEHDGRWLTWADIGLVNEDKRVISPTPPKWANNLGLSKTIGLTTDFLTDDYTILEKRKAFYQCQVETMEGAAIFKVGNEEKIPTLQIRSVSNYVEHRDKKHWAIEEAKEQLHIFATQKLKPLITK